MRFLTSTLMPWEYSVIPRIRINICAYSFCSYNAMLGISFLVFLSWVNLFHHRKPSERLSLLWQTVMLRQNKISLPLCFQNTFYIFPLEPWPHSCSHISFPCCVIKLLRSGYTPIDLPYSKINDLLRAW